MSSGSLTGGFDLPLNGRSGLKKLSLSALVTTQKLERLIAAAPNMGLSAILNTGISAPAAIGIPMQL